MVANRVLLSSSRARAQVEGFGVQHGIARDLIPPGIVVLPADVGGGDLVDLPHPLVSSAEVLQFRLGDLLEFRLADELTLLEAASWCPPLINTRGKIITKKIACL